MTQKLHQKGFAAVEGLLLVIIIALLAGTGYYVYHANQKTSDINSSAAKVAQSSPTKVVKKKTTAPAAKVFAVPEWGVQAAYNGDLTLTYTIKTDEAGLHYALFSSAQLDATDASCKDGGYGGAVTRYKSSDEYLQGDSETDSGMTAAQTAATLPKSTYGHVGDYYYFYTSPQGICAQPSQTAQTQTMKAVRGLVSELKAVTP